VHPRVCGDDCGCDYVLFLRSLFLLLFIIYFQFGIKTIRPFTLPALKSDIA